MLSKTNRRVMRQKDLNNRRFSFWQIEWFKCSAYGL